MALLFIHIAAGCIGIITGYTALFVGKGSQLHKKSGMGFVYAMLVMGTSASIIAMRPDVELSVWSGLIAVYMVATGMITVKPLPDRFAWVSVVLMTFALTIGALTVWDGMQRVQYGSRNGVPAPMVIQMGVILLLGAYGDIKVLRQGPLKGIPRLVRHIWRMCYSMFIATGSFFIGQSDEFPEALRHPLLIFPLGLSPFLVMLYWLWKVRVRRSLRGIVQSRLVLAGD